MERLTERIGDYIRVIGCSTRYRSVECKRAHLSNTIVRLAAYEDSGLTPKEVAEFAKIVKEKKDVDG